MVKEQFSSAKHFFILYINKSVIIDKFCLNLNNATNHLINLGQSSRMLQVKQQ